MIAAKQDYKALLRGDTVLECMRKISPKEKVIPSWRLVSGSNVPTFNHPKKSLLELHIRGFLVYSSDIVVMSSLYG